MESQKAEFYFSPVDAHNDAVNVQGMEDLFQWASETVADGLDGRQRRAREQQIKRQVLSIIHRSADSQAQAKYVNELAYMQRRVIALQGALIDTNQEALNLKQVVVAQYVSLQRVPELEEKVIKLETEIMLRDKKAAEQKSIEEQRKQADEEQKRSEEGRKLVLEIERKSVEEERNHMMNALAKLKKERDILDELLTANETENSRLVNLLNEARKEIEVLKSRRWWHMFMPCKK